MFPDNNKIAALMLSVTFISCKQSSFNGTSNKGSVANPSNSSNSSSTSQQQGERSNSEDLIAKTKSDGKSPLNCNITAESTSTQIPLDVFFSIDVSTSMDSTLSAILSNVGEFSENLAQKGYLVRFGASGFVDYLVPNYLIPLGSSENFKSTLSKWRIQDLGNVDFQEGGQASIQKGLEVLRDSSSANAVKVLIHISDVVGFAANSNHLDFSTDVLAKQFKEAKGALGNFLFFDSVPLSSLGNLPKPKVQMAGLRKQAELAGSALDFPFASGALTSDDLPNLIQKGTTVTGGCQ
jgi:hypothetical protein